MSVYSGQCCLYVYLIHSISFEDNRYLETKFQTAMYPFVAIFVTTAVALQGFLVDFNSTFSTVGSHQTRIDTGTYGPSLEEVHYYYDQ